MRSSEPKATRRYRPTALDLFSGCGGLTLGLKQAGFTVVGAVEIDSLASQTYASNHPEVTLWQSDIRRVSAIQVLRALRLQKGQLDLLAGCPPCQGFSSLRTLNGSKRVLDSRNDLVLQFLRFVRTLRPKAVMMENVPGLLNNRRFAQLQAELETLGYRCNVGVLDAADFHVPQRRRRMILLAGLGRRIPFGKPARTKVTVKRAISDLEGTTQKRRDKLHREMERRSDRVMERIKAIPKDGGSRTDLPAKYRLDCHKSCTGFKDVYGRMSWNDVAPTITSGCVNPSKGRFLHPSMNRAITLREAAVLQAFPRRYSFSLAKGKFAVAEMIGNALPPEFIRRHAINIARALEESATENTDVHGCRRKARQGAQQCERVAAGKAN